MHIDKKNQKIKIWPTTICNVHLNVFGVFKTNGTLKAHQS